MSVINDLVRWMNLADYDCNGEIKSKIGNGILVSSMRSSDDVIDWESDNQNPQNIKFKNNDFIITNFNERYVINNKDYPNLYCGKIVAKSNSQFDTFIKHIAEKVKNATIWPLSNFRYSEICVTDKPYALATIRNGELTELLYDEDNGMNEVNKVNGMNGNNRMNRTNGKNQSMKNNKQTVNLHDFISDDDNNQDTDDEQDNQNNNLNTVIIRNNTNTTSQNNLDNNLATLNSSSGNSSTSGCTSCGSSSGGNSSGTSIWLWIGLIILILFLIIVGFIIYRQYYSKPKNGKNGKTIKISQVE